MAVCENAPRRFWRPAKIGFTPIGRVFPRPTLTFTPVVPSPNVAGVVSARRYWTIPRSSLRGPSVIDASLLLTGELPHG